MTKREAEDQEAIRNLREKQAARFTERMIDLKNRMYWVAAGNGLQDKMLFTGTVAIDKEVRS